MTRVMQTCKQHPAQENEKKYVYTRKFMNNISVAACNQMKVLLPEKSGLSLPTIQWAALSFKKFGTSASQDYGIMKKSEASEKIISCEFQ